VALAAARPRKIRIGDLLVREGVITPAQLQAALAEQKKTGRKLGRVLIDNGYLTDDQLMDILSRQLGIPYVDLTHYNVDDRVARLIPETHARRFRVLALEERPDGVLVGMADPTDIFAYDEVARLLDRPVWIAVVKEADLLRSLDAVYRRSEEISGLAAELEQEVARREVDLQALGREEGGADAPVVRLLRTVLEDAVQVGGSDVHFEPDERELRIRVRIDGVLRTQTTADRRIAAALVSRLKLMAGLDIAEKRLPQDGRFNIRVGEAAVDVRMSVMPVQYGESVVLRLLNPAAGQMQLEALGMPGPLLERFRRLVALPQGLVLVTGPTGSGKTTTLYAALNAVNRAETKIVTVEDPVEYRLHGVSQVQVNPKVDLTFARVLRAILRHDPDVVFVGEMRDAETVDIGLKAALTGHRVFSSLHTNDALATPLRLIDMGAAPYLVAEALRGVVAQRLLRRVCEDCAEPDPLIPAQRVYVERGLGGDLARARFRKGRGCTYCHGTGYRGRVAAFELLELDETLIRPLHDGDLDGFRAAARRQPGYRSLRHAALQLAAGGHTTVAEVMRVTVAEAGGV